MHNMAIRSNDDVDVMMIIMLSGAAINAHCGWMMWSLWVARELMMQTKLDSSYDDYAEVCYSFKPVSDSFSYTLIFLLFFVQTMQKFGEFALTVCTKRECNICVEKFLIKMTKTIIVTSAGSYA